MISTKSYFNIPFGLDLNLYTFSDSLPPQGSKLAQVFEDYIRDKIARQIPWHDSYYILVPLAFSSH